MTTSDTVPDEGAHTLRYRSTRAEVWRFYWRAWRKSLWVVHVLAAVALAWSLSDKTWPSVLLWFAFCLPAVVACLAAVPQIVFKPHERTLHLTPDGWSTTIGSQAGSMPWKAIRSLETTRNGLLIVGATGNAMIVPDRAFDSDAHRDAIVADLTTWHAAARRR